MISPLRARRSLRPSSLDATSDVASDVVALVAGKFGAPPRQAVLSWQLEPRIARRPFEQCDDVVVHAECPFLRTSGGPECLTARRVLGDDQPATRDVVE